ncbi:hypothetical protein [Fusibacter sp. 3D3]|uniref:hypothetical protein n=1 Tax=Fusibacter sp. 3D3 TaxID=1048380 RepID=UPI000853ED76|nr:hypothetical protein [Fusibacter sp. 3D3]GAU75988.1 hypothetical protein F3D3_0584 [Fusibacter sp. 3D3]
MDMQKFYSICLQGNVLKAIEYLKPFEEKNEEASRLIKEYEARFLKDQQSDEINSEDPWIQDVISCYFRYFRSVLVNHPVEQAEDQLNLSLSELVTLPKDSSLDEIELELNKIFKEKGYSYLGGVTSPFRGPYIWKKTSIKTFTVTLPDGEQEVVVYFISDFLMLSWAHFATMGKRHTGGWAKPEGLYYVDNGREKIDINSIEFQVWFLKHEAQHLSDYIKFPDLSGSDLEYRAKLVELIYNPHAHCLIEKFLNQSKDDKTLPHSYAAYLT